MTASPPRPRPVEPFPLATDRAAPASLITRTANPEVPVTNEHLSQQMAAMSQQIGSVDSRVNVLHREMSLTRQEVVATREDGALTRKELGELRTHVMGDQETRVRAVEAKTTKMDVAKKVGVPTGIAGVAFAAFELLYPVIKQWIATR